jgi:hypothetical protein
MIREPIYAALFAIAQNIPGVVTTSRTLKHYDDVPSSAQPAIFQRQLDQDAESQPNRPTKWYCEAEWYLYVNEGENPGIDSCTILNPIMDALEAALLPSLPAGRNSLGGLVYDCKISGKVQIYEAINGGPQTMAIIPIKITVVNPQ